MDIGNGTLKVIAGRGSFQTVAQVNEDTGQVYYRDELSFSPSTAIMEDVLMLLKYISRAQDGEMKVVVELNNDTHFVMGYGLDNEDNLSEFPVWLSGGNYQSGTEKSDLIGATINLASVHPQPALAANFDGVQFTNPKEV